MEIRHRIHPAILARAREMRHPQTPAEAIVWRVLRNRQIGFNIRRQHPIDKFIIDFYCAEAKLLIEIDGNSHFNSDQEEYDNERTRYLEKPGCKVIRFTNDDVKNNIQAVGNEIKRSAEARIESLKNKPIH
ncbi:MAG TPA: endonuclease domain-containing protein [Anaerolineales bacterium]|nr:endonuclease domain-containing protein [Anaerolineales bacterium]